MEEIFIQKIKIDEVRNIKNFEIPLDDNNKKNLIITGKNGSGKTSLLRELKVFLNNVISGKFRAYSSQLKSLEFWRNRKKELLNASDTENQDLNESESQIIGLENWLASFGKVKIEFNNSTIISDKYKSGDFIIAFFEAKRNMSLNTPTGINKINIKTVYGIEEKAGQEFIQYIVNLKADRSFAKDDNDIDTVEKIDQWFDVFEESLFKLFGTNDISLQFDRKLYNFNLVEEGKESYNLNQLSDGFSAILNIVTELIMRMEAHQTKSYDVQGIVLIDEIETHLHIELQKKVLPFLTAFFPKIQFIVTTHSPFVLSSIENAVISDLEKKIVTSDLSGYSYDTLVESYFNSDKYSNILKKYVEEYEVLMSLEDLDEEQKEKLFELKQYLYDIPKFLSDELAVKLQQIRLKHLKKAEHK